jgi:hypothetical protein
MIQKTILTKKLIEQLGVDINEKALNDWYNIWWVNPMRGMRLTERGCEDFEKKIGLTCYRISFPTPIDTFTNRFILDLENFIEGPYYIGRTYIKVFTEKTAMELVLFSGNLEKYTLAKRMSQKNNTTAS